MKSMTGYGTGKHALNGRSFVVEIKSVNHKYFDVSVKLPRTMLAFEEPVRKLVSSRISRGKTDVFISYESAASEDNSVLFNEALGDNLVRELQKMKERYGFSEEIGFSQLCRFQNVIAGVKAETAEADDGLWQILEAALLAALDSFVTMREREGEALKADMREKLAEITETTYKIAERSPYVVKEYKEKLESRLKELVSEPIDEQRLMHEFAVFADKSSIDEELTRLKSHIKQFREIIEESRPVGKKLDFLVQEMMRESNTIASKANDLEITRATLTLKTEIEKIREQVQNVE